MPQVTIKCKWCGKEFNGCLSDGALNYEQLYFVCDTHERMCDKNPANKKPQVVTAIWTGKAELFPVYVPTDEDKQTAKEYMERYKKTVIGTALDAELYDLLRRMGFGV